MYNLLSVVKIVYNLIIKVSKKKFQNSIDFDPNMLYHYKCSQQGKQKKRKGLIKMELNTNITKEDLNQLVHNLLETVNNRYQVNIFENELREIIDVHEEEYLFSFTIEYDWLSKEYSNNGFKELSEAIFEEYLEKYLS